MSSVEEHMDMKATDTCTDKSDGGREGSSHHEPEYESINESSEETREKASSYSSYASIKAAITTHDEDKPIISMFSKKQTHTIPESYSFEVGV